jgi:hypothetical protein
MHLRLSRHLIGGFVVLGLTLAPGIPAKADTLSTPLPLSVEEIHRYARQFVVQQDPTGSYFVGLRVQAHEKAEIAMALAAEVTQTPVYAESAYGDLQWVIANRLEPGGGLNWDGPDNPFFFECHQHWFLIASEMIRGLVGVPEEMQATQRAVWEFLRNGNPAAKDLYLNNRLRYGPFYAYRSVDRAGEFQTQAPFKGSYEIGTALWSLSLVRDLPWLQPDGAEPGSQSLTPGEYLLHSAEQTAQVPQDLGWFDPQTGQWVRSLLWISPGWLGWDPPDWKYALGMQEGALVYKIKTGGAELDSAIHSETEHLLSLVRSDGTISSLPDIYGSPQNEYGEALCVLALSAEAFIEEDPTFAVNCLRAAQSVAWHVAMTFPPHSSEDGALMLRGLARVFHAQTRLMPSVAAMDEQGLVDGRWRSASGLRIWPNPMSDAATISFSLPAKSSGLLWISDLTGRQIATFSVRATDAGGGTLAWDGRDGRGRLLPAGSYRLVLDSDRGRQAGSVVIVR